jgi:hypothetical protein
LSPSIVAGLARLWGVRIGLGRLLVHLHRLLSLPFGRFGLAVGREIGLTRTLRGGLGFPTLFRGFRSLLLESLLSASHGGEVDEAADHHKGNDYQNGDKPTVHDKASPSGRRRFFRRALL